MQGPARDLHLRALVFFIFAACAIATAVTLWLLWQGICIIVVLISSGVEGYTQRKVRREAEGKKSPQARFSNRR